jgi:hypothetical protein
MDEFPITQAEATEALRAASGNVEDAIRLLIEA